MSSVTERCFPKLQSLPATLPLEGAVRIELEEGVPIFRASKGVQTRPYSRNKVRGRSVPKKSKNWMPMRR